MMQLSPELLDVFARRHHFDTEAECPHCTNIVRHAAMAAEKTKDHATMIYEPCPKTGQSASSIKPLSATEKAHWQDLYWGLRGAMDGYDPSFVEPPIEVLDRAKIIQLGEDEPYAVIYRGTCSFSSLLHVANDEWDGEPFGESACRYMFGVECPDKSWLLCIGPNVYGAELVTAAFWEEPDSRQRGAI